MAEYKRVIWTVGTAYRPWGEFIQILLSRRIELVADVRRAPGSKLLHYCKKRMEELLAASGILYRWLGEELGGWRSGGYQRYTLTDEFLSGIRKLEELASARPTVVCCAELRPERCHRWYIAEALVARGWTVLHIMRGGPEDDTPHRSLPGQPELFPG